MHSLTRSLFLIVLFLYFLFLFFFLSTDTGQVTKLGPRKSSSNNLTLPPSFRSPTWSTNRTQTPFNPSSTSPSSSPTLSRSTNHSSSPSHSTSPHSSSSYKEQTNYTSSNPYESSVDSPNGFTRAVRPASAGTAQQSTKTTEKEYIHNLQQVFLFSCFASAVDSNEPSLSTRSPHSSAHSYLPLP
jgi:hypothetical protein